MKARLGDVEVPGEQPLIELFDIEQLDLEGNPLDSWPAVLAIAQQLPKLSWLGLNQLRLQPLLLRHGVRLAPLERRAPRRLALLLPPLSTEFPASRC